VKAEDLLFVVMIGGVVLTCLYLVNECISWRSGKAIDLKARLDLRELYKKVYSTTKPYVARVIRRK
jgi:hypothetical protein